LSLFAEYSLVISYRWLLLFLIFQMCDTDLKRDTTYVENDNDHPLMEGTAWSQTQYWGMLERKYERAAIISRVIWTNSTPVLVGTVAVLAALAVRKAPLGLAWRVGVPLCWGGISFYGRKLFSDSIGSWNYWLEGESKSAKRNQRDWADFYRYVTAKDVYLKQEQEVWRRYKSLPVRALGCGPRMRE
jgi:hypothetical protein